MPNQPKTKNRVVRVPDGLWDAAQATAADRGDVLSEIIRRDLRRYVAREDMEQIDQRREARGMLLLVATQRAREARELAKVAPKDAKVQGPAYFMEQAQQWDWLIERLDGDLGDGPTARAWDEGFASGFYRAQSIHNGDSDRELDASEVGAENPYRT